MLILVLLFCATGRVAAQQTFTFNNTTGGLWGIAANWTPTAGPPNATTDIARFDRPAAYNVDVDGTYTLSSLQFAAGQTSPVNVRQGSGSGDRWLTLFVPGAAGSSATTLTVEAGTGNVGHTLRSITYLGGGSAGNAVNHVWDIQGTQTLTVFNQIRATSSSRNTVTKTGTGTLILQGNSFGTDGWSGGLTIAGGLVLANSANASIPNSGQGNSTGTGPVTVNNTGTLGGSGKITLGTIPNGTGFDPANVVVNAGGTLTAGTSAAAPLMEINSFGGGGLVMNANSTLAVKLFGTGATELSRVNVAGDVTVNTNRIALDLDNWSASQANQLRTEVGFGNSRTYRVLATTLSLSGSGFDQSGFTVSNTGAFLPGEWSFDAFNVDGDPNDLSALGGFVSVRFTPIPEPQTVLGGVTLAGLAAVGWRRLRTASAARS